MGRGGGGDTRHGRDGLPLLLLLLLAPRCNQRVLDCSIGRPLGWHLRIEQYYLEFPTHFTFEVTNLLLSSYEANDASWGREINGEVLRMR